VTTYHIIQKDKVYVIIQANPLWKLWCVGSEW